MRCKHCKDKFVPKAFLQKYCMLKDECVAAFMAEFRTKRDRDQHKQHRTEAKQLQQIWKRYNDWLKDLENEINAIARTIDFDMPCISCGYGGRPNAGHYLSVGHEATLRYNLHNIHLQCYQCNVPKGGNIQGYDEGIIRRYGRVYWEYIKFGLKNAYHQPIKPTVPEIKDKLVVCHLILKELKKNNHAGIDKIILRDKLNTRIGIYMQPYIY